MNKQDKRIAKLGFLAIIGAIVIASQQVQINQLTKEVKKLSEPKEEDE